MGLNSEYGKDKWEFIAVDQAEGVSKWEFLVGNVKAREMLAKLV